jgi:hypothetical protein
MVGITGQSLPDPLRRREGGFAGREEGHPE